MDDTLVRVIELTITHDHDANDPERLYFVHETESGMTYVLDFNQYTRSWAIDFSGHRQCRKVSVADERELPIAVQQLKMSVTGIWSYGPRTAGERKADFKIAWEWAGKKRR